VAGKAAAGSGEEVWGWEGAAAERVADAGAWVAGEEEKGWEGPEEGQGVASGVQEEADWAALD